MGPIFILFKSEIRSEEGHLKQMRKGLRNNLFFLFGHICTILISDINLTQMLGVCVKSKCLKRFNLDNL